MAEAKTIRLKEKIEGLRRQMQSLREIGKQVEAAPDKQVSLTDPDARSMATSVFRRAIFGRRSPASGGHFSTPDHTETGLSRLARLKAPSARLQFPR